MSKDINRLKVVLAEKKRTNKWVSGFSWLVSFLLSV